MLSRSFSLSDFFAAIDGMNYFEATIAARQEVQAADSLSSRVKGAVLARQQGSGHYADVLRKYLFFLQNGIKPFGIMEEDFAFLSKLQTLCGGRPIEASSPASVCGA